MRKMRAVPKPPKSDNGPERPVLTEFEYEEIGEQIGEALEFGTEVTITLFYDEKFESISGVIKDADAQTGRLTLYTDAVNSVKINMVSIVSVE